MSRSIPVLIGLLAASFLAPAQETRCTLSGSVTDPTGSAVGAAGITVLEARTNSRTEVKADTNGLFTVPYLVPGDYTVEVQAPGFQRYAQTHLLLSGGDRPVIAIQLRLGELTQAVTVSAEMPLLASADASTGQVVLSSQVENLPLNGRTPFVLVQYTPGVTSTVGPQQIRPFDNAAVAGFSVGGLPNKTSELLIDGAPDNSFDNAVAYNPPVDGISEVRVHTFESDAAYGHTAAGVANQITKGGTNQFHGSLYEFNETSALASNSFFNNASAIRRPVTRYNQYGVSAGGPLEIPKLVHGRDRVFWNFAFEGIKASSPSTQVLTVPTAAEKAGDFSALLALGSSYQLYDPRSASMSGGVVKRTPLSGNVIPSSQISPIAQKYLSYYPAPNTTGRAAGDGGSNFTTPNVGTDDYTNQLSRWDFNVSERHKLFVTVRHNERTQLTSKYFDNDFTGSTLKRINWGSTLDDVYTLSPTTVANVRLNLTRYVQDYSSLSSGFNADALGFPTYMSSNSQQLMVPNVNFGSCNSSFQCLGWGSLTPALNTWNSYSVFASLTQIRGRHTLKAGLDARRYQRSYIAPGASQGSFSFDSTWTKATSSASAIPFGGDMAAFLLGVPTSGSYDVNAFSTAQYDYYALFLQDDWRVRNNLTINLGLRFEHETPTAERYNRTTNGFDASADSPVASAAKIAYAAGPIDQIAAANFAVRGGLTFAGADRASIYESNSYTYSPRVGLAWTPNPKTVFRGGFGMFVGPTVFPTLNQQGFSQTTQMVTTNDSYLTPAATLADPFPHGISRPVGASQGLSTFLGQSISFFNPSLQNGYSLRWQGSAQRQLNGSTLMELTYIGNHSVRLPINQQRNFIPRQYLSTSLMRDADDNAVNTALTKVVKNPLAGLLPGTTLNGSTTTVAQLLAPFPQFPVSGLTAQNMLPGSSIYHSLGLRVERRTSGGLTFNGSYGFSKNIERASYLNDSDSLPEKRISTYDRPHHVVATITWSLPFGKGRRYSFSESRLADAVVGGWVWNTVYTFQSGAPLSWGNLVYLGGDLHLNAHAQGVKAFDTTQFLTKSADQPVYNIRVFPSQFANLRADCVNQFDASFGKTFTFWERLRLQFRMEGFNVLNRTQMGTPNLSATSTSFGTITSVGNTARQVQVGSRLTW